MANLKLKKILLQKINEAESFYKSSLLQTHFGKDFVVVILENTATQSGRYIRNSEIYFFREKSSIVVFIDLNTIKKIKESSFFTQEGYHYVSHRAWERLVEIKSAKKIQDDIIVVSVLTETRKKVILEVALRTT